MNVLVARIYLSEAQHTRKKIVEKLHDEKVKGVDDQIEAVRRAYQKRLKELQEQNIELKETVGKLMNTIKEERQRRS